MPSFAPQVATNGGSDFYGNALRFATYAEAEANVADLASRWMLVTDTRVVESEDAPTHTWHPEKGLGRIEPDDFADVKNDEG